MRLILPACLLLVACTGPTKPDLPEATLAEHTVTERVVTVRVDPALTAPFAVPEARSLSECPVVARERQQVIEACNARLQEIDAIEGTDAR